MEQRPKTVNYPWHILSIYSAATLSIAAMALMQCVVLYQRGQSIQLLVCLVAFFAAGYAGVTLTMKTRRVHQEVKADIERRLNADGDALPAEVDEKLTPAMRKDDEIMRLCTLVASVAPTMVPDDAMRTFRKDKKSGELTDFQFRSTKIGVLSTSAGLADKLISMIRSGLGDEWTVDIDTLHDTVTGSKKDSLPRLALPDMWPVAQTIEEAAGRYKDLTIKMGIGEDGPLSYAPKEVPHVEAVGATGGGKSVAVRSLIMQYMAAGSRCFFLDGKGTDYASLATMPNVSAVSTDLGEHIGLIHVVYSLFKNRQRVAQDMAKRGDNSWRTTMYPILLVMDEWKTVRGAMTSKYKPAEMKLIDQEILTLLMVGREFRVHVILATQGMEAKTVPGDWLGAFKVVQSLGRPDRMTISKAFPEDAQREVTRKGQQISPKQRGRALVTVSDDDGAVVTKLYQSYWSYSPAEDMSAAPTAEVRQNWEMFKQMVVDRIPHLYERLWLDMVYPEGTYDRPDSEDENYVDLSAIPPSSIQKMTPVIISDVMGQTLPGMEKNDPRSMEYAGVEQLSAGSGPAIL